MTEPSNWLRAMMHTIVCPKCDGMNKPNASPTIERNEQGQWTCNECGQVWRLDAPK